MNSVADTPDITRYSATAVDFARQREVVAALSAFLRPGALLYAREDVQPYECDGLSAYRQIPMIVTLPETEDQVQRILSTCYAMRVPVVGGMRHP